jgi:hypothetical protein
MSAHVDELAHAVLSKLRTDRPLSLEERNWAKDKLHELVRIAEEVDGEGPQISMGTAGGLLIREREAREAAERERDFLLSDPDNVQIKEWHDRLTAERDALHHADEYAEGVLMRDPFDDTQRKHAAEILCRALSETPVPSVPGLRAQTASEAEAEDPPTNDKESGPDDADRD